MKKRKVIVFGRLDEKCERVKQETNDALLLLLINLVLHFKIVNYLKYMGGQCQGIQNQLEGTGTSPNLDSVTGIGFTSFF